MAGVGTATAANECQVRQGRAFPSTVKETATGIPAALAARTIPTAPLVVPSGQVQLLGPAIFSNCFWRIPVDTGPRRSPAIVPSGRMKNVAGAPATP
jgi:hypothetical protein